MGAYARVKILQEQNTIEGKIEEKEQEIAKLPQEFVAQYDEREYVRDTNTWDAKFGPNSAKLAISLDLRRYSSAKKQCAGDARRGAKYANSACSCFIFNKKWKSETGKSTCQIYRSC